MACYGIVNPDASSRHYDFEEGDWIETPDHRLGWHKVEVDHDFSCDGETAKMVWDDFTNGVYDRLKGPWAVCTVIEDHGELNANALETEPLAEGEAPPPDFVVNNDMAARTGDLAIMVKNRPDVARLNQFLAERATVAVAA